MVVLKTGLSHYAVNRNSVLVTRVTVVLDLLEEVTLNTIMRSKRIIFVQSALAFW